MNLLSILHPKNCTFYLDHTTTCIRKIRIILSENSQVPPVQTLKKKNCLKIFQCKLLAKTVKSQNIEPMWSFDFVNMYNISFLGKKILNNQTITFKTSADESMPHKVTNQQKIDAKQL